MGRRRGVLSAFAAHVLRVVAKLSARQPQSSRNPHWGGGRGVRRMGVYFLSSFRSCPTLFLPPLAPELGQDLIMGHGNALVKPRLEAPARGMPGWAEHCQNRSGRRMGCVARRRPCGTHFVTDSKAPDGMNKRHSVHYNEPYVVERVMARATRGSVPTQGLHFNVGRSPDRGALSLRNK